VRPYLRFALALAALALVSAGGTLGYVWIEDYPWQDALYMTVITLTTVGYMEVRPLGPAGRWFTMALLGTGVGLVFYLATAVFALVFEGRLREILQQGSMLRRIEHVADHVIVCGFGRFGRVVCEALARAKVPLVIIESDASKQADLDRSEHGYLIGDAAADDVLERAGVARARAIVVGTSSDADNVFITLAARERNPKILIHARGESDGAARRLAQAGAQQVVSAYQMGGMRVAASILRPAVLDFLELSVAGRGGPIDIEEIRVDQPCALLGRSVGAVEAGAPRVRVVALKRGADLRLVPERETEIAAGDVLVAMGERSGLDDLARQAQAPGR
jgi:voltage-gated potassium channel